MRGKVATIVAVSALALVALVLVPASIAGRGGNGTSSATEATLSISPNPVAAWGAQYWGSGCGYVVGTQVNVLVNKGTFFPAAVDANGCISFTWYTGAPGTYLVETYQRLKGRKQTLMASTTFDVV
ncbi:MAG TPA: hypothetical protein VNJ46_02615 [Gaiellaceae bacterium]|nr:hypothetical protein [Gaiellaceae bacterium]